MEGETEWRPTETQGLKANLLSLQSLGMELGREEVPRLGHQGSESCHVTPPTLIRQSPSSLVIEVVTFELGHVALEGGDVLA